MNGEKLGEELKRLESYLHSNEERIEYLDDASERNARPATHALKNFARNIGLRNLIKTRAEKMESALASARESYDSGDLRDAHKKLGDFYVVFAKMQEDSLANKCKLFKESDEESKRENENYMRMINESKDAPKQMVPGYLRSLEIDKKASATALGRAEQYRGSMQKQSEYVHNLAGEAGKHYKFAGDEKGYVNALGEHLKVVEMVGDATGVKPREKHGKLEKRVLASISLLSFIFSLFFLSPTLNGFIISTLNSQSSGSIGVSLFLLGIIFALTLLRE